MKPSTEFSTNIGPPRKTETMRRIVLDTNCLLAILPSQSPYHKVWTDFLNGNIELCVSTDILIEYEEILSQKTSVYFADLILIALINRPNLIRITPTWHFNIIQSDPDDNKFVDCAVCGQAEFIVSKDKHYKILEKIDFPYLNLLTLQEFVALNQ